jgi:hypothetical protein
MPTITTPLRDPSRHADGVRRRLGALGERVARPAAGLAALLAFLADDPERHDGL